MLRGQLFAVLTAAGALLAWSDDPSALSERAKEALAKADYEKAIQLLEKADGEWEKSSPNTVEHAQALIELALAMRLEVHREAERQGEKEMQAGLEEWRKEAAPFTQRAVRICKANATPTSEPLALALELQADVLGRTAEGAPLWARATKIRAARVAEVRAQESTEDLARGVETSEQVGHGVSQPVIVQKREPQYTQYARSMFYSGSALLKVIIDAQGVPRNIQLVQGLGYGLDEKAAEAVAQWRFRPAMKNGVSVAVMANIQVNFRLL